MQARRHSDSTPDCRTCQSTVASAKSRGCRCFRVDRRPFIAASSVCVSASQRRWSTLVSETLSLNVVGSCGRRLDPEFFVRRAHKFLVGKPRPLQVCTGNQQGDLVPQRPQRAPRRQVNHEPDPLTPRLLTDPAYDVENRRVNRVRTHGSSPTSVLRASRIAEQAPARTGQCDGDRCDHARTVCAGSDIKSGPRVCRGAAKMLSHNVTRRHTGTRCAWWRCPATERTERPAGSDGSTRARRGVSRP